MIECILCEHDYTRGTFKDQLVHNCFKNIKDAILLRKKENPEYLFKKKELVPNDDIELDGGGWCHVRHCPKGVKWHKAKDHLNGIDVYGTPYKEDEHWSIQFNHADFN